MQYTKIRIGNNTAHRNQDRKQHSTQELEDASHFDECVEHFKKTVQQQFARLANPNSMQLLSASHLSPSSTGTHRVIYCNEAHKHAGNVAMLTHAV